MTDTDLITSPAPDAASAAPRRRGGLTGMVLADLRGLASEMGISDTAGMRKGDLIVAIKARQSGTNGAAVKSAAAENGTGQATVAKNRRSEPAAAAPRT
ncbi:MAG: Rho termination factor N-terminal domain-containing protein, partial [Actinomycetota bacterium]|nr:Rho termination factor N-terminal domain-containing protein [Actinomycetota bacterium]